MQTGEGERGEHICPGQESRLAPPGSGVLQAKMLCNHSVHLGDLHIPPCSTAIEGGENGVAGALCSSRERCLPLLHQLLVHFGAWLRPQEPIIQPRALGIGWGSPLQPNALSCLVNTAIISASASDCNVATGGAGSAESSAFWWLQPVLRCFNWQLILFLSPEGEIKHSACAVDPTTMIRRCEWSASHQRETLHRLRRTEQVSKCHTGLFIPKYLGCGQLCKFCSMTVSGLPSPTPSVGTDRLKGNKFCCLCEQ